MARQPVRELNWHRSIDYNDSFGMEPLRCLVRGQHRNGNGDQYGEYGADDSHTHELSDHLRLASTS